MNQKNSNWVLTHQQLIIKVKKRNNTLDSQNKIRYQVVSELKAKLLKNRIILSKKFLKNHSARIIQKAWKQYLIIRYHHLGLSNINDCDPATLAEIRLIPKTDLYIWTDLYGKSRGGDLFQFLQWMSKFSYLETPTNYCRIKLSSEEVEWFINHGRKMVKIKRFSNNPDDNLKRKNEWNELINYIENIHLDRVKPERVYSRLINSRDRQIAQLMAFHQKLSDLITLQDLERYLESILKNSFKVPDDLKTIIQNISLKDLVEFQVIWKDIDYFKKEINKFEFIFFN
jgi:hypothetical protein